MVAKILMRLIANNGNPRSLSSRMRFKRYQKFVKLVRLQPDDTILDVGMGNGFALEVFNQTNPIIGLVLSMPSKQQRAAFRGQYVVGDGCALPFRDHAVPVVFSNSVIEHVGSKTNVARFAAETIRVGQRFYVQTPNRRFPLEPHYLVPWFQYFPERLQRWLLAHFRLGWYPKGSAFERIFLQSKSDLQKLFPRAVIIRETLGPLTKSFMVVKNTHT